MNAKMMPMHASLRRFRNTLIILLPLLSVAGALYASYQSIPAWVAVPLIAAILVEIAFYIAPGFEAVRKLLESRFKRQVLALMLVGSAMLPYVIYAIPTGQFALAPGLMLLALASVVAFWFILLPRNTATDIAFVMLMAGVVLSRVFSKIYLSPQPRLHLEFLGQLMWIRTGIFAALSLGYVELAGGFRFWPNAQEWKIGARNFLYFMPAGILLGFSLEIARWNGISSPWWKIVLVAAGTFIGMLWVLALSEEFFFRGLLQEWFTRWLNSQWAAIAAAALLFGLVHLPFRGFPNWRFAALAGVAGLFYGRACLQARSFRAAMVCHALVNTVWRVLLG